MIILNIWLCLEFFQNLVVLTQTNFKNFQDCICFDSNEYQFSRSETYTPNGPLQTQNLYTVSGHLKLYFLQFFNARCKNDQLRCYWSVNILEMVKLENDCISEEYLSTTLLNHLSWIIRFSIWLFISFFFNPSWKGTL